MKYSANDKVVIYSKTPCPYCVAAKNYFFSNQIPFTEHDLTGKFEEMSALKDRTGHRTFPQIFINEEFIGGFDDLMAKVQA